MTVKERIEAMKEKNPLLSNTEIAYHVILACILDGELSCGERLNQEGLASAFGISRTPVRDALALLEKDGFVTKEQNGHYKVYELELSDYLAFCTFRQCIEGYAAFQAAQYATTDDLDRMRDCLMRLKEAEKTRNFASFLSLDDEFHQLIIDSAKNHYLEEIYEEHKNKVIFYRRMLVKEDNLQFVSKKHEQIFYWIVERNPENTRKAMEDHVKIDLKRMTN